MDQLNQARKELRAARAALTQSLQQARARLNPAELFEDVLDVVDTQRRFVDRVQSGVRQNPLVAIILLMGAVWLISDRSGPEGNSNRRRKHNRASPNHRGDYDDSQLNDRDQWADLKHGEEQNGPRP